MPTGWRPADVAAKYPVYKIEDVYHFEKYDTPASPAHRTWYIIQLVLTLGYVSYLFGNIALINTIDPWYIYLYGLFVFLHIYSFTDLMDRNRSSLFVEVLKNGFGAGLILYTGDWFGLSQFYEMAPYLLLIWFAISTVITFLLIPTKNGAEKIRSTVSL